MSVVSSGLRKTTLRKPMGRFPDSIDDKPGCNEIAEVVASSGVNFCHSKPRSAPGLKLSLAREWKIAPIPARCHDFTSRMSFPIPFLTGPLPQHHCRSSKVFLYCTNRPICIFNTYVPSCDFHAHTVSHFGHFTKSDLVSSALHRHITIRHLELLPLIPSYVTRAFLAPVSY
jgi:hypothetical protein